jgi:hypothetical protein
VFLAVVVVTTPFAVSGVAETSPSVATAASDGPLLSQVEAVGAGDGAEQHLDGLDGTRKLLPFVPGSEADFSPDGSKIVYLGTARNAGVLSDAVLVRDAGGATSVLGFLLADDVRWSGDGTYVVASAIDPGTGIWSLWRLAAGAQPVKLLTTSHDASGSFFDVDPVSDVVTYISNQDIYTVDAITKATGRLTHNCESVATCSGEYPMFGLDWAPAGDRIAVLYRQPDPDYPDPTERLGWLTPGDEMPAELIEFEPAEYANTPRVSPSGTRIALEMDDSTVFSGSVTKVVASTGASVATLLPALAHVAWQPCPTICAEFVTAPASAPSAAGIGRASSGASGGRATARAAWRAPGSNGGSPVTSYRVEAMRLNASNHVVARVHATTGASARAATMRLAKARYRFRVQARNALGAGAWSAASNIVRAR